MKKLQVDLGKRYNAYAIALAVSFIILSFWTFDTIIHSNYKNKQNEMYWKIMDVCDPKGSPVKLENGKTRYDWNFDEAACRKAISEGEKYDVKTQSCEYGYIDRRDYGLSPIKKSYHGNRYIKYDFNGQEEDRNDCVDDIEPGINGSINLVLIENRKNQ